MEKALKSVNWANKREVWHGPKKYGILNKLAENFDGVPDLETEFETVQLRHGRQFLTHSIYNMHAAINDVPDQKWIVQVVRALSAMLQRGNLKCATKFTTTVLDGPSGPGACGLTKCCYFKVRAVHWLVHEKFSQCCSALKSKTTDFVVFSDAWPNEHAIAMSTALRSEAPDVDKGFVKSWCAGDQAIWTLCLQFLDCAHDDRLKAAYKANTDYLHNVPVSNATACEI